MYWDFLLSLRVPARVTMKTVGWVLAQWEHMRGAGFMSLATATASPPSKAALHPASSTLP